MNSFTYESQGTNTYLVYLIGSEEEVDTLSLGMITNNSISGLAQAMFLQMDESKYIKYNVSAKVSVAQFFAGVVNKKRLLGVFLGIVDAMLAAEDYMLDPASIILDLDYIFTDVSTCETDLICLPVVDLETQSADLKMFFRNIMFNTQFDQTENCDHVAKIINYLNGTASFSLNDFKKLLVDIQNQKEQTVVSANNNATFTTGSEPTVKKQPVVPTKVTTQPKLVVQPQNDPQPQTIPSNKTVLSSANNPAGEIDVPTATKKQPVAQPEGKPETGDSKISFFYLIQHYNKENAAAYQAQKEAKKRTASEAKDKAIDSKKAGKQKKAKSKTDKQKPQTEPQANSDFSFAVPGHTPVIQPSSQPVVQQTATTQKSEPQNNPIQPQEYTTPVQHTVHIQSEAPKISGMNFGETVVLDGGKMGETTVLNKTAIITMPTPYLVRIKTKEKITIDKPIFRIGKEKSYVDYFISDNTAISRSHANIITREERFFIVDTNSTNHTFIDGQMIPSNSECEIVHGARLRLANEDFEFYLY